MGSGLHGNTRLGLGSRVPGNECKIVWREVGVRRVKYKKKRKKKRATNG